MSSIREDAQFILDSSIQEMLPGAAVKKALERKAFHGKVVAVSIGKAAWTMASSAYELLGEKIDNGVVVTKYEHSQGEIPKFQIIEAGHPVPDENSVIGANKALEAVQGLTEKDTVLFLISGGGSALFEKPLENISLKDMMDITDKLLKSGADIVEMNTVRKHLSSVKGGRFAKACYPAKVYAIVLSDVLGDRLDTIASGPACADGSTCEEAIEILKKYDLHPNKNIIEALKQETPKEIVNCETVITGSVKELCKAAAKHAKEKGYQPIILTSAIECEAKEAGSFLGSIARSVKEDCLPLPAPCAIIAGGETVVRITGKGKGGRNQEIALSAARSISGLSDVVICSVGSDGTDGPTDAAGGMVDGDTMKKLLNSGIKIEDVLKENNSYQALKKCNDLVITGPTGTNVNDLQFILVK